MRILLRLFIFLALALGLLFGALQYASESGEVVVLEVPDADGKTLEVRLWVVDHLGAPWLRAGSAESDWFKALEASERVALTRHNIRRQYRLRVLPKERSAINDLMQAKYGWREDFIGKLVGGRATAMPIRLEHLK